jgi:hypothetical protein
VIVAPRSGGGDGSSVVCGASLKPEVWIGGGGMLVGGVAVTRLPLRGAVDEQSDDDGILRSAALTLSVFEVISRIPNTIYLAIFSMYWGTLDQ